MSMYVRVKRQKLTIFLHVEPTDTVGQVKGKLEELIQTAPGDQQLFKAAEQPLRLDVGKTLAELGIATDDVLVLALKQEDGSFEAPSIAEPETTAEGDS